MALMHFILQLEHKEGLLAGIILSVLGVLALITHRMFLRVGAHDIPSVLLIGRLPQRRSNVTGSC